MNKNEIYYQENLSFNLENNLYFNEDNFSDFLYEKNETNSKINENTTQYISKEKNTENVLKEDNSVEDFSRNSEIRNNAKKKIKKKCGRKTTNSNKKGNEHNKYSSDNLIRKCKHIVLKSVKNFLNRQLEILYKGNIGNGIFKKQFQTIKQTQKSNAKVDFNKNFIYKTIGEIFSENISSRITNLRIEHNKLLIHNLINENDDEYIKNYFNKIFNLQFIEVVDHFIGKKHIDILNGLECYEDFRDNVVEQYDDKEFYSITLKYYLNNFKDLVFIKKGRKSRKTTVNN